MKVSVLIPLFNSEEYISETIKSVLQQTYQNIEIIVVDDGSTDSSYEIAMRYESAKVKVMTQSNKGASSARNKAFTLSTGDFIQYLDADDLLAQEKIEKQIQLFSRYSHPNAIMSSRWGRFEGDSEGVLLEDQEIDKSFSDPKELLIDMWNGKGMVPLHAWLVPRSLIERAGLWEEELSLNDDGEFFCRVLLHANTILFTEESKVYYRSNINNSISQTRNVLAVKSELKSYQLYVKCSLAKEDSFRIRKALASNFLNFIYQYHVDYPHLASIAENDFHDLQVGKMWPVGGKQFQIFATALGFKKALMFSKAVQFFLK